MDFSGFFNQEVWVRIGMCVLCGFIVGFERQLHKKPIDIRTSVLICLGTMLFIYLGDSLEGDKDSTRVLGQVVTGIGFLGAGAIFTREGFVIGMTSASVVWVLAGIGSAIGFGMYETGVVMSLATTAVLSGMHWVDKMTESFSRKKG